MPVNESLMIPVFCPDEQYRGVMNSLKLVRAAGRQAYAVLFAANAAGADIGWHDERLSVKPVSDRAKTILAAACDYDGKAHVYQIRGYVLQHLLAGYRSFVFDEVRRAVSAKWRARDPEFPTASHGYLALNDVRGLAQFRGVGIGFPAATARPKIADHEITLSWCDECGPVSFRVGTLDPGRWHRWRRIVSGEWPHGTIQLNERDGRLRVYVTYERPCRAADLDAGRKLTLRLSEDGESIQVIGPDGLNTHDSISLVEARDWCARLRRQTDAWNARKAATGSPRKPWGEPRRFRAIAEHLRRVTLCRENGQRGRNHAWARRIVTRACDWRCGLVEFMPPAEPLICGHPWQWAQLRSFIEHKVARVGGQLAAL